MFTDGLDHNALQWIRQEEEGVSNISSTAGEVSFRLGPDLGLLSGRGRSNSKFGLPPSQLANGHMHSGLLRSQPSSNTANTSDDWEESVGSISACNDESGDTDVSEHSEDLSSAENPLKNGHATYTVSDWNCEKPDAHLRKPGISSITPKKMDDAFVDLYFPSPPSDRHIAFVQQPNGRYDTQGPGGEHGGFLSDDTKQESLSGTASDSLLCQPEVADGCTSEAGQIESKDYQYEDSCRLSQSLRYNCPCLEANEGREEKYFTDFLEGKEKGVPSSTQLSSDFETSDDENLRQEQAVLTLNSKFPAIFAARFRYPEEFVRSRESLGADFHSATAQRQPDEM